MLRRNQVRLVRKLISFNIANRAMSEIKLRAPVALSQLNPLGDTNNGWQKQTDSTQRVPIERLVFCSSDQHTEDNERDANCVELENANYNAAIEALTNLQSNARFLRSNISGSRESSFLSTIMYLERSGLTLEDVEQLSVIHVAGTKGKGSTCALTESILRQYGARTGFFSSPHLASTNERVRIDGQPLAKPLFTHYFWLVYNRLMEQREHERDMPPYFMFLTIFGLHVFLAERVDVVILEVGIGGELDCTNILRNVRTAGITSLALEHTELLGNTLRQIAWQKAGIIKPGAHVYTHVRQPECLQVIHDRAVERNATVVVVADTENYFKANRYSSFLETLNEFVRLNGALAIQLAYDWLRQTTGPLHRNYAINDPHIAEEVLRGVANAHWPGRCQLVEYENMRLHLDGAHTVESMRICCDWFQRSTTLSTENPKILVFNRTGDTDTTPILLELQQSCAFDMVCFVPNLASANCNVPDQTTLHCSAATQQLRAKAIATNWHQLCAVRQEPNRGQMYPNVWDAFATMRLRYANHVQLDVLVTGSIHLLGATVSALNEFRLEAPTPTLTNGDHLTSDRSPVAT